MAVSSKKMSKELYRLYQEFRRNYDNYLEEGVTPRVFSINPDEDAVEIKRFLEAIKFVHSWYCLPEKMIKDDLNQVPYVVKVQKDNDTDEHFIQIPELFLSQLGWKENDVVEFVEGEDSTFIIKKQDE
jgi:hypothetical protein